MAPPMTPRSMIDWDMGVAVFSAYDADGFLGVQYDAEGEGESGLYPYEVQPVHGCLHRPVDPEVDPASAQPIESKAATVLFGMEAGHGHAIVLGDPRTMAWLPLIHKGETLVFNDFSSFLRLCDDGYIALMTTDDNTPSGQTVARTLSPTAFDDFAPWGRMTFDQYGYRLSYVTGAADSASFSLGYLGGPVPGLSSLASLVADQVEIDASAISIGPTGLPQSPVARVDVLMVLLGEYATAYTALAADVTALGAAASVTVTSPTLLGAAAVATSLAEVPLSTATLIG